MPQPVTHRRLSGFELAGEIVSVGKDVKNFNVGDRVLALKTTTNGAFAQKCAVREDVSPLLHQCLF